MSESIKQVYNNIYNLIFNAVNGHIGQKFDKNLLAFLENNIKYYIKNMYPNYTFEFSLNWDQINRSLNPNFTLNSIYFPIMKTENYITHLFVHKEIDYDKQDYGFNIKPSLICSKCNIEITESGQIIDGDFSCNDYIIKNIIE